MKKTLFVLLMAVTGFACAKGGSHHTSSSHKGKHSLTNHAAASAAASRQKYLYKN